MSLTFPLPNNSGLRRVLFPAMVVLAGVASMLTGCGKTDSPAKAPPAANTADGVLQRMIAAYQKAGAYSDRGVVRLKYKLDGQWMEDEAKLGVKLARPNRLQLRAYQLAVTSDGERLHAIIHDPQTNNMDGQVRVRETPSALRLDQVYEDPLVLNVIASGMGGPPVTLELLIGDEPLKYLFEPAVKRELLSDSDIQGKACQRVQATLDDGKLVLWVDRQTHLLRRLEYPSRQLAEQMARDGNCSDVTLVAEFRDARFGGEIPVDEFDFRPPAGAKRVQRFVVPPQPLASDLIGRLPQDFFFTNLDGQAVARDSLLGQPAVLVWFNDHPASQITLGQIDEVRQSLGEAVAVSFLGVCTEPSEVGHSQVRLLAQRWNVRLPLVRDLEAFGRDVFRIPWAPTVVVLDARGVVQIFEVGANLDRVERLTTALRELSDGKNLAGEALAKFQQEQLAYEKRLAESAGSLLREARGYPNDIRQQGY